MGRYTQILYHIVFGTKNKVPSLDAARRPDLYHYMWGVLKNKQSKLLRVGGVEDHMHILTSLHPTIALAALVKDLKVSSSLWIKERQLFPAFSHWQDGYGAFTISRAGQDALSEYIKGQEEHHRHVSF